MCQALKHNHGHRHTTAHAHGSILFTYQALQSRKKARLHNNYCVTCMCADMNSPSMGGPSTPKQFRTAGVSSALNAPFVSSQPSLYPGYMNAAPDGQRCKYDIR